MIELGPNRYGKSAIRLVKIVREARRHDVRDLTVTSPSKVTSARAYTAGDNANVVATDTMKNTVYALAPEHLTGAIEAFALVLARHYVEVRRSSGPRCDRRAPLDADPTGGGPAPRRLHALRRR